MNRTAPTSRRSLFRLIGVGGVGFGVSACSAAAHRHQIGKDTSEIPVDGTVATAGPLGAAPLNTGTTKNAPAVRPSAAAPDTIMIIRHAEKPTGGKPHGVTVDGETDKHALTVTGWARAGALVELFASSRNAAPDGLRRPDAVYAGLGGDSDGLRPMQTVVPLAARLGQEVVTRYGRGAEPALAAELARRPGATLVCWEHQAIADIVSHLGPVTPAPPPSWPDDRFDLVWVFTRAGTGWQYRQVPQLLLAGDRA